MSSLEDSITALIDKTITKLTTIKENIVGDRAVPEDCIPKLSHLEKSISALRNLLIYRDNLLGSSVTELSKKYKLTPGRVSIILKESRKTIKSLEEI